MPQIRKNNEGKTGYDNHLGQFVEWPQCSRIQPDSRMQCTRAAVLSKIGVTVFEDAPLCAVCYSLSGHPEGYSLLERKDLE